MKFKTHKSLWKDCENCDLAQQRSRVVLARGKLPCDVLFVGEAPGVSEDTIGKPFVGPAGKLLDKIINLSKELSEVDYSFAITNLVACFPREAKRQGTYEPEPKQIKECRPRLTQLYLMAHPDVVVLVGKLADKHFPQDLHKGERVAITHPAAILRADQSQQGLMVQTAVVNIVDGIHSLA